MTFALAAVSRKTKAGSLRAGFCLAWVYLNTALAPSCQAEQHLEIGVDPRLELLSTVQVLSQYRYLTPYRIDYTRDLIAHFSGYHQHLAVALFRNLSAGQGWSDAYPTAMLYLSDPPALEEIQPIPAHIYHAFRGRENFTRFIQALRDFARQTHFNRFFARKGKFYLQIEEELRGNIANSDPIDAVENYFGTRQISYHLIIGPLLHHGGFGPHIGRPGGPYDVYTLLGPTSSVRGVPEYGPRDQLLQIIWHEFSHAFVNSLCTAYYDSLMTHSELFTPLVEPMNRIGYTRWLDCANEHLIRAITARLAHHHLGPEVGRQTLREESGRGFRYIHALAERLEEYEVQRDTYPTFADFFPHLIEVFADIPH